MTHQRPHLQMPPLYLTEKEGVQVFLLKVDSILWKEKELRQMVVTDYVFHLELTCSTIRAVLSAFGLVRLTPIMVQMLVASQIHFAKDHRFGVPPERPDCSKPFPLAE